MGGGVSTAGAPGGGRAYRGFWGRGFIFTAFAGLCHGEWWWKVECREEESVDIASGGKMKFKFFRDWSLNFRRGDWSVNEFLHPGLGEKGFNGFRKFVAAFFTPQ